MLKLEGLAVLQGLTDNSPDSFSIVWVNALDESLIGGPELAGLQTVHAIQLVRPGYAIGKDVPRPSGYGRRCARHGVGSLPSCRVVERPTASCQSVLLTGER